MELVIEQPSDNLTNALTLSYAVSVKSTTPLQQQLVSKGATNSNPTWSLKTALGKIVSAIASLEHRQQSGNYQDEQ